VRISTRAKITAWAAETVGGRRVTVNVARGESERNQADGGKRREGRGGYAAMPACCWWQKRTRQR